MLCMAACLACVHLESCVLGHACCGHACSGDSVASLDMQKLNCLAQVQECLRCAVRLRALQGKALARVNTAAVVLPSNKRKVSTLLLTEATSSPTRCKLRDLNGNVIKWSHASNVQVSDFKAKQHAPWSAFISNKGHAAET